jgi:hypothetical protein
MAWLMGAGVIVVIAVLSLVGDVAAAWILKNLAGQRDLALGASNSVSYSGLFAQNVVKYLHHLEEQPMTLMFGDGYGTYGAPKGSDIGIIETLERFGLPLFTAFMFGLASVLRHGWRATAGGDQPASHRGLATFCVAVLLLALLADGHYSIWGTKAILPIIFFAFAMFDRDFTLTVPGPEAA